jgi:hypothetical protein
LISARALASGATGALAAGKLWPQPWPTPASQPTAHTLRCKSRRGLETCHLVPKEAHKTEEVRSLSKSFNLDQKVSVCAPAGPRAERAAWARPPSLDLFRVSGMKLHRPWDLKTCPSVCRELQLARGQGQVLAYMTLNATLPKAACPEPKAKAQGAEALSQRPLFAGGVKGHHGAW